MLSISLLLGGLAFAGDYLAIARRGVTERELRRDARRAGGSARRIFGSKRTYMLKGIGDSRPLARSPLWESVEEDDALPAVEAQSMSEGPVSLGLFAAGLEPNDPEYAKDWALHRIDAPRAWAERMDGSEVVVAVIDSGIDLDHPDLEENLWVNEGEIAGNGKDDDKNGYVDDVHGADTHNGTGDADDVRGHGTQVAGVIGAVGDNARGSAGILWKARIMSVRADDGQNRVSFSGVVKGGYYAAAMGAKVVNGSWGTFMPCPSVKQMIEDLEEDGVILVNAVGNIGNDLDTQEKEYPASYRLPNMIVATATNKNDELVHYASFGRKSVEIGAPGWAVRTLDRGGKTTVQAGTSMAAPFVVAAAALVWASDPSLDYSEVKRRVLDGADRLEALDGKVKTGRLNLARALLGD